MNVPVSEGTGTDRGEHGAVPGHRLIDLRRYTDARGSLGVIEHGRDIGFPVRRVYFMYAPGPGSSRGAHAHRELEQLIVALQGSFDITLDNGRDRCRHRLDGPVSGLYVGPRVWRDMTNFSADSVCLVLASQCWDDADYIRDYGCFVRELRTDIRKRLTMKVPFLDLRAVYAELGQELDDACRRVAASGWYLMGTELEEFEADFAGYCGVDHCAGVGSGLDALVLILRALGVGPGDEVIVPAHTFIATWLAVSEVGARPVPVECDEHTYNMDPGAFEAAVTARTAAVIPVHLYGQPADMEPITRVAVRHGLAVLEDASQAHGARYQGHRVGTFSTAAAFSLNPVKNLGGWGNAGAVVSNDAALMEKIRLLRNYGYRVKYQHEIMGVNSRLDEIQAAILRVKLRHLDEWNDRRRALAAQYAAALAPAEDAGLILPHVPDWAEPVWHQFVVRHPARQAIQAHLSCAGIDTLIHYPVPVHLTLAYRHAGWREGDFPVAERLAAQILSLPISPHLPAQDAALVASQVAAACRESETPAAAATVMAAPVPRT